MHTPVLFLIFNRPDTTAEVFATIRAARPPRLYVAADGAREGREGEAERCAEARRIASEVDWDCEVKTLFRDENLGCCLAVSGAIDWFFEHEEEGIILEDDCLPDPSFFPYCEELLERYRDDKRVMCITGDNFQEDMRNYSYSYYYSKYNHCWGWATWQRAWQMYDTKMDQLEEFINSDVLEAMSLTNGFSKYWEARFDDVLIGRVNTWDYIWTYTCWSNSGLTCTPSNNLISNIGFGEYGTHTTEADPRYANRKTYPLYFPLKHPPAIFVNQKFDAFVDHSHFWIGEEGLYFLLKVVMRKFKAIFGGENK